MASTVLGAFVTQLVEIRRTRALLQGAFLRNFSARKVQFEPARRAQARRWKADRSAVLTFRVRPASPA